MGTRDDWLISFPQVRATLSVFRFELPRRTFQRALRVAVNSQNHHRPARRNSASTVQLSRSFRATFSGCRSVLRWKILRSPLLRERLEAGKGIEPISSALQASGGFFQINGLARIHFRQFVRFRGFSPLFWFGFLGRGESDFIPPWLRPRAPNTAEKSQNRRSRQCVTLA